MAHNAIQSQYNPGQHRIGTQNPLPRQAAHYQAPFQPQVQAPQLNQQILSLLIQLLQLLIQTIGQQEPQPKPEPQPLSLTPSQQNNVKQILGIDPNAPFGVQVLDNDGNGTLSAGDTAIVNGGITGGEIQRKELTDADISQINTPQGNVPAEFSSNLQKWQQSAAADPQALVSYTTQQTCFCPVEFTRPINIDEQGGQIVNASYADTGEAVPDNVRQSLSTIDQRFAQLNNAYETGAQVVNARYDADRGFPTTVFIDQSQLIADEEINYTISNLAIALP